MTSKTSFAIALPALLAASIFLPSAAAEDLTPADALLAPEPFVIGIEFVDGVPVLSGSVGETLCEVSLPQATAGEGEVGELPGVGLSVSCSPDDSTLGVPTCHVVAVGAATGLGGYASVSAGCGSLGADCTASNGSSCQESESGLSWGTRWCSFYMRAPAAAYCAFG